MATADAAVIHPTVTGEAAKIIAQHQDQQDLILHAGWFYPFVQRAWISLEEKGIPYQYKEVNPYKKEPHFLAINPRGLVPAIEYDGVALNESLILCQFINDPDAPKMLLLPPASTHPVERAQSLIWIDHVVKLVTAPTQRLRQAQTKEAQDREREELCKGLRTFVDGVDGDGVCGGVKGPYWAGDEFSLVDIAIAPWIMREWVIAEIGDIRGRT